MVRKAVLLLVLLCAIAPVVVAGTVRFEPVTKLLRLIATAENADKETVATALAGFMEQLVRFLETQGVPSEASERVVEEFERALEEFLADRTTADDFGQEIAALARGLQELAGERGIRGLPVEILQRIGVDTEAIEALREGKELSPEEIVELARKIAERVIAEKEAGPSEEAGPPEDAGPPEKAGPPEEAGPPEDAGPPEEAGPPEKAGPPEDAGPPEEAGPPGDKGKP